MLEKQKQYDFKKELLQVHKKDIRDYSKKIESDEVELKNGICIVIPKEESDIIFNAAKDFQDYLLVSMGISAMIAKEGNISSQQIVLSLSSDIGEANGYMGHSICVSENSISVEGYDECGVAQGLYLLEDLMNIRKAPFVKIGKIRRKSLFERRITQSPFGMFEYPDEALSIIAHRGYNTIMMWIKDGCTSLRNDYIDLRLLSERAEKYGIGIAVELYAHHSKHPDEPDAQEYYDKLYGDLFEECPKIVAVELVGEANHFSSRDPKVGKAPASANYEENIPTGKISPGWYPCCDYPQWVDMIKKSIRKYNSKTEILFCTYNWGMAPEEDRVKLIENLPKDITLLATWDMFHQFRMENSVQYIADYSLKFVGPGEYFASEAVAAKKRGIKLASITNTAGRTWDFGVIPYEPMPQQWIKRFKAIVKAHDEWNLNGLMENIHYGFHPSIIGDLEKWSFFTEIKPIENIYEDLLVRDYGDNADCAKRAMEFFSEAINYYSITNEDQYGAFRIGPSYPIWTLEHKAKQRPQAHHAMHSLEMMCVPPYFADVTGNNSLPGVRIFDEIKSLEKMNEMIAKGIQILEECEAPCNNLLKLLNLARFMYNTTITAINVKEHYILKNRLKVAETAENAEKLINEIEALLLREKGNVENTIPLVQVDSRLGWEPSMEYTTDEASLKWKLKQLNYELNYTIKNFRKSNDLINHVKNEI